MPYLEIKDVSKNFSGVKALKDVSFGMEKGEVHAVIGENGAGKSTLMKIIAGVIKQDSGQISVEGENIIFKSAREAQNFGIAIIHQELNLIPEMSIAENIYLGREYIKLLNFIDYDKLNCESSKVLEQLNLMISPAEKVKNLRVGEKQLVEIAKALSLNAKIIIMDEPTSALNDKEIEYLFKVIKKLKRKDVLVIYISHKLDEVFETADRVSVLRDGNYIGTIPVDETTRDELICKMVGRELKDMYPRTKIEKGEPVLELKNFTVTNPVKADEKLVDSVNFVLHKGEIFGISGLLGAGRTELLSGIFGLYPYNTTGEIKIKSNKTIIRSPKQAIKKGMALVTEERKETGLIMEMTVKSNLTLTTLSSYTKMGFIYSSEEKKAAEKEIDQLNIRALLNQLVKFLSGGNQQKVVLGKWLLSNPEILLMDEPTRGIDVGAKAEIYALMDELTHQGMSIIMASSELLELLAMCDRIMVLCEGRQIDIFSKDVTQEKIMEAATKFQSKIINEYQH